MTTSEALAMIPPRAARRPGLLRGLRYPQAKIGLVMIVVVFGAGLLAPFITSQSPFQQTADAFAGPSMAHLLGTDEYGRDLFARVLYGIRQNLIVGLVAVPIGVVIGTLLGLLSLTAKGVDLVVQRFFDVSLAFTGLVLGVTVAAIIGPGLKAVLVTVAMINVPLFGRLARNSVRSLLGRDFVTAARVLGAKPARLLLRHILPNALDPLVVQAALSLSLAVFTEGAMSFVGIGVLPPEPSLGSMLRTSINFLSRSPLYAISPMVVVTLLVLAFNMVGDSLNKGLIKR